MGVHAETYAPAFKKNGGLQALEKLEQGIIPEKDLWKYSSFWFKSFDDMAYKTMLRQLISKWGIMSIDMQTAFTNDMTFKDNLSEESAPQYADDDIIDAETVSGEDNTQMAVSETVAPVSTDNSLL